MERRILLETLANQLPQDAVQFSSKLANIERSENGEILLELENGTRLCAKVHCLLQQTSKFSECLNLG